MQKTSGVIPLAYLFFITVALCFFSWLAEEMMEGDTHAFDTAVILFLRNSKNLSDPIGPPWLEQAMLDCTSLGSGTILAIVTIAAACYLMIKKKWHDAFFLGFAVGGGALIGNFLKHSFGRPRPDLVVHIVKVSTLSFPSGHAMVSAITYITIGALLARHQSRPIQIYIFAISILLAMIVGISRVYLGVHWPTDVLASWSGAVFWVILCWFFKAWLQSRYEVTKKVMR